MTLILTVRNPERLGADAPREFRLDGNGAVIGRSSACDWSLPDPDKHISSRHCEVTFGDGAYVLKDLSTNGTFLNGASERMGGEHPIKSGDRFRVGPFELEAEIGAASETTVVSSTPAPASQTPAPAAAAPSAPSPAETSAAEPAAEPETVETTMFMDSSAFAEMMDSNKMDWDRAGFGDAASPAVEVAADANAEQLIGAFAEATGIEREKLQGNPADLIVRGGALLKRLAAGLVVMVEARARAKAQMGAEVTQLQLDGNNPIKFARTPEGALTQLLNPVQKGFLDGDKAVEDAYLDVQAHQFATIAAIPGALRTTLERFSPGSIKRRAEKVGILSRIITSRRDAALWHAYEKEFAEVANQSDDAFMQVFSREFRKAYERQMAKRNG